MAQKHNEQYVNAPMTRLGTIGWPDQDRRVIRSSAFVASKWTAENPILQLGEVGYETDTNKLKVGDGVTEWNDLPYAGDGTGSLLPEQSGHSGEFLTTDGTDASWAAVDALPDATGASEGDLLALDSNGDPAWTTPASGLPDQTGQSGKFLTTDGTDASWSDNLTKVNTTVTLAAANWSGNAQTVSVTGITATGVVFVNPDPADQADYTSAGIICSAQAAGTLTFTCDTTPANDIDVVVVML